MFWSGRKTVVRVVGGLDAREAGVVGAVAGAHGGVALLEQAGEVEVRLAVRERRQRRPRTRACRRCWPSSSAGSCPGRVDAQHPLRAAVAERGRPRRRRAPSPRRSGGRSRACRPTGGGPTSRPWCRSRRRRARRGRAPSSSGARPPGRTGPASAGSRGTRRARSCRAAGSPARAGARVARSPSSGSPAHMPATPTYGAPRSGSGSSSIDGQRPDEPRGRQLVGRVGDRVAPAGEHARGVLDRVGDVQPEHLRAELVQAQLEGRDDAEVAAAAAQRPVQVRRARRRSPARGGRRRARPRPRRGCRRHPVAAGAGGRRRR